MTVKSSYRMKLLWLAMILLFLTQLFITFERTPGYRDAETMRQLWRKKPTHNEELNIILKLNALKCPDQPKLDSIPVKSVESGSAWQVQSRPIADLYIYSAYYDDRPGSGFLPTVRVIIFAAYVSFDGNMSAFCHLWYDDLDTPYIVPATINETGMNQFQFDDKAFREFMYTCDLPLSSPVPRYVSITFDQCEAYTTRVPVTYHARRQPLFDFGVCVANGYGHPQVEEFVEWMELNMIFGVTEFNLYDTKYENMSDIFEHYKNKEVLVLNKLPHPLKMSDRPRDKLRNLRSVALNDCMLRNMYRYRYLVVIDHDEVIVPRTTSNYRHLLTEIDSKLKLKEPFHSYTFDNAFFLSEFKQDESKPKYLKTLRYRIRGNYSELLYYATKSFVSPLACFNLFNHYCRKLLPAFEHTDLAMIVPNNLATSHHYRNCGVFYQMPCDVLLQQMNQDDVMLKFEQQLMERVREVFRQIGRTPQ